MAEPIRRSTGNSVVLTPEEMEAGMCFAPDSSPVVEDTVENVSYPDAHDGSAFRPYARGGNPWGAAMLKGRDPATGIDAELISVSGQVGAQPEVSAGMARVGIFSDDGTNAATMDVFTARMGVGTHNRDGSRGVNVGATATAIGVEGTIGASGWSFTAGAAVGVGADVSVGTRDQDRDGKRELCGRITAGPVTLGACVE